MRKIVIICPYLFRLTRGIERFCISLSKAFADKGYNVVIYAWGTKTNQNITCGEIDNRIKIRKVPYCRWFQELIAVAFYRLWLLMDNPLAIVLNFLYHGETNLPKGRKYLYVLHSPASQIPHRYDFVKTHINKYKNIHVIAISKAVRSEALPYLGNIPMSLIYNGTDTDLFHSTNTKQHSGTLRIITAAAFEERKGMHYMIEAIAKYPKRDRIKYDIYGGGNVEYEERLASLIDKYHLENIVCLKGSVDNIPEILPKYDVFVLLTKVSHI